MKTGTSFVDVIKMALPIFLGSAANTLVTIIDTAFLGRVGTPEQSAAGYAFMFLLVPSMIAMGFSVGIQILVARRNGEGRYEQSGPILKHGLSFLLIFALFTILFLWTGAEWFFDLVLQSGALKTNTLIYLRDRSSGIVFSMLSFGFISYFVGLGLTYPIMVAAAAAGLVNILLDYLFIFGHGGFEPMGLSGAAYATALAECISFLILAVFAFGVIAPRKYGLNRFSALKSEIFGYIFRVSGPLMMQHFISITSWFLFFTLIENSGERNLAMSIIMRAVYALLLMPILAYGSATSSMVSNLLGQGRQTEVYGLVKKIVLMSVGTLAILSALMIPFFESALSFFTEDKILAADAARTRYILAIALVMMAASYVLFSVISGTGKTWASLVVEASGLIIYIGFTVVVTVVYPSDILTIWFSEIIYMFFWGVFSVLYLRFADPVLPKWSFRRMFKSRLLA
jgi:putative MATE family efflux protein